MEGFLMANRYRYTKPKTFLAVMLLVFVLFMICVALIVPGLAIRMTILIPEDPNMPDKYVIRINELFEETDSVTLQEVFNDVDFSYAYIFTDPNINGETLARRYSLDINLDNVKGLHNDSLNRIVFLDENREVVLAWEYSVHNLIVLIGEYFVYPDTVIVKETMDVNPLAIRFLDVKEEQYFGAYPEASIAEFNESIKEITQEELIEQNTGIDNTQCIYGDYYFIIPSEPQDKHQFLYRKSGNDSVLILYSEYGINTVSLGQELDEIYVTVNVMIDEVLTNIPINIDVTEYDRDKIWVGDYLS